METNGQAKIYQRILNINNFMGLDMTLSKKHYVGNKWRKPTQLVKVTVPRKTKGVKDRLGKIDVPKITYIETEVMYWRKANAIHNWFINNCADGDTNQATMSVSRDNLKELLDVCKIVSANSVLVKGKIKNGFSYDGEKEIPNMVDGQYIEDASIAQKLLPCTTGFFFGSQDYDEYYLHDIKETIKVLEKELKTNDESYPEYEYHASW